MIASSIHAIYKVNLGIKKWEKALVFTDRITSNELVSEEDMCRRERLRDIALLTAEIGKPYTKRILYHEYPSVTSHGTEPPAELWELAFGCKTVDELKKQGLLKRLLSKRITDEE
ncbi:MAG: hypothetical protein L0Y62_07310, partial [Nitrospirae bacterium]|nr:hypothetical protein [Nitrospirota bacterium]